MPRVFRLVREKWARAPDELLTGAGAAAFGGRWNEKGTHLVYAASHLSLAVLEALVHSSTLPSDMVVVGIDLPESSIVQWGASDLPPDWATYPSPESTRKRGTAWARKGRDLAVWVPSAVVPSERNCLINPKHADARHLKAIVEGPFPFDPRLRP